MILLNKLETITDDEILKEVTEKYYELRNTLRDFIKSPAYIGYKELLKFFETFQQLGDNYVIVVFKDTKEIFLTEECWNYLDREIMYDEIENGTLFKSEKIKLDDDGKYYFKTLTLYSLDQTTGEEFTMPALLLDEYENTILFKRALEKSNIEYVESEEYKKFISKDMKISLEIPTSPLVVGKFYNYNPIDYYNSKVTKDAYDFYDIVRFYASKNGYRQSEFETLTQVEILNSVLKYSTSEKQLYDLIFYNDKPLLNFKRICENNSNIVSNVFEIIKSFK